MVRQVTKLLCKPAKAARVSAHCVVMLCAYACMAQVMIVCECRCFVVSWLLLCMDHVVCKCPSYSIVVFVMYFLYCVLAQAASSFAALVRLIIEQAAGCLWSSCCYHISPG